MKQGQGRNDRNGKNGKNQGQNNAQNGKGRNRDRFKPAMTEAE